MQINPEAVHSTPISCKRKRALVPVQYKFVTKEAAITAVDHRATLSSKAPIEEIVLLIKQASNPNPEIIKANKTGSDTNKCEKLPALHSVNKIGNMVIFLLFWSIHLSLPSIQFPTSFGCKRDIAYISRKKCSCK
jgi:hypothetical protein